MMLGDYLAASRILIGLEAASKSDFIVALSAAIAADLGYDPAPLADALLAREKLGSTAIGRGVALPHAKATILAAPVAAAAILKPPLLLNSAPDDTPIDLVIAFLSPSEGGDLPILSQTVRHLRDERWLDELRNAATPAAFLARASLFPDGSGRA